MTDLEWAAPPLDRAGKATGARAKYTDVIEALRANRGEWAVIATYPGPDARRTPAAAKASAVNTGRMAGFAKGEFEATVAGDESAGFKVYVRARPSA